MSVHRASLKQPSADPHTFLDYRMHFFAVPMGFLETGSHASRIRFLITACVFCLPHRNSVYRRDYMPKRTRPFNPLADEKISASERSSEGPPIARRPKAGGSVDSLGWGATSSALPREALMGYAALLSDLGIVGHIPVRQSVLAPVVKRERYVDVDALGRERTVFPGNTAARGGSITNHLFTALRYDGVDLETLRLVFEKIHAADLQQAIRDAPLAVPSRKAWFLYEWITGKTLDAAPLTRANTVPLLDPELYVTCEQGRSSRHGVTLNLLGTRGLCPTIRRTDAWETATAADPLGQRDRLASELDSATQERINRFLVTRESHSTYAIEGENSSPKNDEIFYALLKKLTAADQTPITNDTLHHLQLKLLESSVGKVVGRYRNHQIWVGDRSGSIAIPSHIAPKAEDVAGYMDHFCAVTNGITDAAHHQQVNPIAAAVVTSGLLAYIHPFDDGNGRVGRLLLQKPLTSFAEGRRLFLPVSAAINRHREAYFESLDAWSKPLLSRIRYENENGGVRVTNDTKELYRFPDLTRYAEFIAKSCGEAVSRDLVEERQILALYDKASPALRDAGLSTAKAELFFTLTIQNAWKLGKKKIRLFPELPEPRIAELERTLRGIAEAGGASSP